MKALSKTFFLLIICVLFSCEENATTTGDIHGRLVSTANVDEGMIVGQKLSLYQEIGGGDSAIIDSLYVPDDLTFSFEELSLGVYVLHVDSPLLLEPNDLPVMLTQDSVSKSLEYAVELY